MLPFLSALGIGIDEIDIERTLRLRLGRNTHEYTAKEVSGRLDVLVRSRNGDNLFVVELKAEDCVLSEDDRDQGISYARLLDHIAPFVLVTNGRESRLYDSISRREITNETLSRAYAGFQARVTLEDIRIRFEALKHFIGYSPENVAIFSKCQQADRMNILRGSVDRLDRKYIPDLYSPRQQLRDAFARFLAGSDTVFAITGESGVGKTNEMCALAESYAPSHITLFFAACAIPTSLTEVLVDDFNWQFSEEVGAPVLFRRLSELASGTGRSVLIFVDALDEAPMQTFAHSISEFALHLKNLQGSVRLIVSVKSVEWSRFGQLRGSPSALACQLDTSALPAEAVNKTPKPFLLTELAATELADIERKYQRVFHLHGLPTGRLRAHCRLPFFLRIVSEVYGGRSENLSADISEPDLLRLWLERKFSGSADREAARLELFAVARAAYDEARDGSREGQVALGTLEHVPEEAILRELGKGTRPVTTDLVSQGILLRHQDHDGRVSFSFYYSQIRDYLIARQVLRLDQSSASEFAVHLDTFLNRHILRSVLSWHLRDAPPAHFAELRKVLSGRAMLYVHAFNRILDELLPGTKAAVEPYTEGAIGLAYDAPGHGICAYTLYAIGPKNPEGNKEIRAVQKGASSFDEFAEAVAPLAGRGRVYSGGVNFSNAEPSLAAAQFVRAQVKEAIRDGGLDDLATEEMLIEACIAIVTQFRDRLSSAVSMRWGSIAFPIDLHSLDEAIQAYFGAHFYWNKWTEQQIATNSRFVTRGKSSVTIVGDPVALKETKTRAVAEAREGKRFPTPNIVNDGDLNRLLPQIVARLLGSGLRQISPVLPLPDRLSADSDFASPMTTYSDRQLIALIETFFSLGLQAYKDIVERNFPGVRELFTTYLRLPLDVIVEYQRPASPRRSWHSWGDWGSTSYVFLPATTDTGVVRAVVGTSVFDYIDRKVMIDGATRELVYPYHRTDLFHLLHPGNAPGFARGFNAANSTGGNAPIRAFAYSLIREEFARIGPNDLLAMLEHNSGRPLSGSV